MTAPLKPLPKPKSVAEVLSNIDQIVDWAIKSESQIGYFAVVYQRVPLAIRTAINAGVRSCGVTYGFQPETLLDPKPDLLVDRMVQLVEWVLGKV